MSTTQAELRRESGHQEQLSPCMDDKLCTTGYQSMAASPCGHVTPPCIHRVSPAGILPATSDIDCESRGSERSGCSPVPDSPGRPAGRPDTTHKSNFCIEEILKPDFGRVNMGKDGGFYTSAFAPWSSCFNRVSIKSRSPVRGADLGQAVFPRTLPTLSFPYDLSPSHRAALTSLSLMSGPWAQGHEAKPTGNPKARSPRRPQPYVPRAAPVIPSSEQTHPSPPNSPRVSALPDQSARPAKCGSPIVAPSGRVSGGECDDKIDECEDESGDSSMLWPAWVYCTRYSDRPSSGPRSRKMKRREKKVEEKRPRTAFTSEQLAQLRREFEENRYLTEERRQRLATELNLNESQIKIWFQNKRAKMKKATGQGRNGLALQLMAQGLYNHSTVPVADSDEEQ